MEPSTNNPFPQLFLRIALAAALLSAVADRFGCWPASQSAWGNMTTFIQYTGKITSFLPAGLTTTNAYLATFAETVLGILLILGYKTRWVAMATGVLLLLFAISMTLTLGIKSTFDYSVWVGSAGAFLLSTQKHYRYSLDALIA
ncbi:DoxX-like protein [Chitinophaga skermanii]|uniref:DoxX-like protein n=1 Tax=Chitinophaga skermanii TaxID=331697 RepID=A0A327QT27_9BACT|nr:DoxX family protein [Chitinophaga skermanii]RAJ07005.1 DoxX-like protein [Chitinophaga skermanii]